MIYDPIFLGDMFTTPTTGEGENVDSQVELEDYHLKPNSILIGLTNLKLAC